MRQKNDWFDNFKEIILYIAIAILIIPIVYYELKTAKTFLDNTGTPFCTIVTTNEK